MQNLLLRDRHYVLVPGFGDDDQTPGDNPKLRTEKIEQAAVDLQIPVLLIRGKTLLRDHLRGRSRFSR
ncbi:hypothetical protein A8144_09580 [Mycobacterium leprae 3125609]|uniref:hypothetical protein n=1 Tax=Mycobacterium leprae TaxID=1769 RepID=UPI0007DB22A8|nr:hypothetical protein A8144_09580 [Mycobacterium leprae 3125609]OAX70880.1 hypothetical protein A3216_09195 [Mycobacterium leprae 7935681]